MKYWKLLQRSEIKERVFKALDQNASFFESPILGVPASHLDSKVFYQHAPFLQEAPFISTLVHNPNHIGCHTLGETEYFFKGTQELEKELINICACDILNAQAESCDGYVTSGGTEANMQAMWIYRNYFLQEHGCQPNQIAIVCSDDAHYSMDKAANVLGINLYKIKIDPNSRKMDNVADVIEEAIQDGIEAIILVLNMMTTMFGSVDDENDVLPLLKKTGLQYCVHVDGAYGGFFYPFSGEAHHLDFGNENITSVTLDAHKMVQAPYGTGVFLIRKGWMQYAKTREASYVIGQDNTLIGSRSGANAVAIWMILMTYGPHGWNEKIHLLLHRTNWLATQLNERGISFFRQNGSNIITIPEKYIHHEIAKRFVLVPDNHEHPSWYKIVVMEHVTLDKLSLFLEALDQKRALNY